MELQNEINNEINNNIKNEQNNFLNTVIGKTINDAIDFGLKTILPDLIENQIIDIKNSLLKNGLKDGVKTAIDSAIDLGKSAIGIFTGKFENIKQIENVIKNGGIIDSISSLIDKTTDKAYQKGHINKNINTIIKKGKNVIIENIENNIKRKLEEQNELIEKLESNIDNWKQYYKKKDYNSMKKEYIEISKRLENTIPIENILKEARNIENLHKLMQNKENKFEITDIEKQLICKLN